MTTLLAALLLLSAAPVRQDEPPPPPTVSIGKSAASRYRAALKKYQEAQEALEAGDAATAHDKASEIIDDPKIEKEKRECLLRIQNADSTWDKLAEFFPVRVRAQTFLAKAKKQLAAGNKEDGLAKL